ncbi:hypothetical protein FQ186_06180 [Pseudomonas sp. ANT_H14]|nr:MULTISPECIES: hypothetical protein [unclassified Pseudomonas]KAA0947053.1 hypothetical protein FQ182_11955 [Pseudomonas sp. ANT_H4]KAA0953594.1 hypothetical protein FQ186_06180 [Pseudomonas sp. ANT_H14]
MSNYVNYNTNLAGSGSSAAGAGGDVGDQQEAARKALAEKRGWQRIAAEDFAAGIDVPKSIRIS